MHHDIAERCVPSPPDHVHRPGGHSSEAEQTAGRRAADHEVGKGQAGCEARLLEADVVAAEPEHTVVDGDEELTSQQLSPAAAADARPIELVERDEPVLNSSVREHG